MAWAPPEDDPLGWQAQINGSYYVNISGKADISLNNDPGMKNVTISNLTFDPYVTDEVVV